MHQLQILNFNWNFDTRASVSLTESCSVLAMVQLNNTISVLRQRLTLRQKEAADLKAKYNLG